MLGAADGVGVGTGVVAMVGADGTTGGAVDAATELADATGAGADADLVDGAPGVVRLVAVAEEAGDAEEVGLGVPLAVPDGRAVPGTSPALAERADDAPAIGPAIPADDCDLKFPLAPAAVEFNDEVTEEMP